MNHQRQILLVDDDQNTLELVSRWLTETPLGHLSNGTGAAVKEAHNYEEALAQLETNHFHVTIVDISLDPNDEMNSDGFRLLRWIGTQPSFHDVLPCIVLSGKDRGDLAMDGVGQPHIKKWVKKKASYKQDLLSAVKDALNGPEGVNFDLGYDSHSDDRLPQVAEHVVWTEPMVRPDESLLQDEVRDLFGKQFYDAQQIHFYELTQGLSGAAVVKVKAKYDTDYVPAVVLKIGRRDKVETEHKRVQKYVVNHLPNNTTSDVRVVYAGHLGALRYKFAEAANHVLDEFDVFMRDNPAPRVCDAVHSLFEETCSYWYKSPKPQINNIIDIYYDAFNLGETKLISRIRDERVLPAYDPMTPQIELPEEAEPLPNPLAWLRQNRQHFELRVCQTISHGDLTGRNVFVNDDGHCWLIDFYRTRRSHMLRDFAILETDIKYRILPEVLLAGRPALTRAEYMAMEQALAAGCLEKTAGQRSEVQKATQVMLKVRELAAAKVEQNHRLVNWPWQILGSRLMTHLNVTRLRHIDPTYKRWALATAGRICAELEHLPPPIL